MSLTKTVNYTQNVITSLGYSNELTTTPSRTVEVRISNYYPRMGRIIFPETAGVTISEYGYNSDGTNAAINSIIGEVSAVNTCLNGAQYVSHFYECDNIEQNFLTQDRQLPADHKGELLVQIPPNTTHGLSNGDYVRFSSSSVGGSWGAYKITKIDGTNCPTRFWMSFDGYYDIDDIYFSGSRKTIAIGDNLLKASDNSVLGPVIDLAYCNCHGDFIMHVDLYESGSVTASGTLSFVGSFYVPEPTFTSEPPTSISATPEGWNDLPIMGQIAQADNGYQSVQVLFKSLENDPLYLGVTDYSLLPGYPSSGTNLDKLSFIGATIEAKAKKSTPAYSTSTSYGNYGLMGTTRVGSRISKCPNTGIIRWHFYGTPSECNQALNDMQYFRLGNNSDFSLEIRIVNGKHRIYRNRGK